MGDLIRVVPNPPRKPEWEWNTPGITKMLKTSPEVLRAIEKVTQEVVNDIKDDINRNMTTSYGKDMYGISESASYFANNVRGQVVRSSKRQKGIPLGMVAMKADNAIAYEAAHGNFTRVAQETSNAL